MKKYIKMFDNFNNDVEQSIETIIDNIGYDGVMKDHKEEIAELMRITMKDKISDDCIIFFSDIMVRAKNGENVYKVVKDNINCINMFQSYINSIIDSIMNKYKKPLSF